MLLVALSNHPHPYVVTLRYVTLMSKGSLGKRGSYSQLHYEHVVTEPEAMVINL